jgi:integrase
MVRLTIREDGRPVRVAIYGKTAADAEKKARAAKTQIERGQYTRDKSTLAGYALDWLERKAPEVSPRTTEIYRQELTYALPGLKSQKTADPLGAKSLKDITPAHIREILEGLKKRYSLRTVKMVRQRLWQVFRDALDMELVYRNPVEPVRIKTPRGQAKQKVGRALELHETQALLTALDVHPDPRTALALRLMLACGLRRGEALGLQWQDIDLESGLLTVRRVWTEGGGKQRVSEPKTAGSARTVPIPAATLERMVRYRQWWTEKLGENPPGEMWLFPGNKTDKPLDANAPNHALRRIAERLGIPHLRVHDLRHSYGSHLLANGAPLELVAERMGHANGNITLGVYRHLLQHERKGWVIDPEDLLKPRAQA